MFVKQVCIRLTLKKPELWLTSPILQTQLFFHIKKVSEIAREKLSIILSCECLQATVERR